MLSFNTIEFSFIIFRPLQSIKSLNKNKQIISSDQTRSLIPFDSRWLEEFRQNINRTLEQIEQRFNHLINPNSSSLPTDEQIKSIQELINYIKTIQITCSDIQSSLIVDKQRELKVYTIELMKKSLNKNQEIYQNLTRLLIDLLLTLINYIQTYCQAFLIPYEVEIYNNENQTINIEQFKTSVKSQM
jgi:hypothetical protein